MTHRRHPRRTVSPECAAMLMRERPEDIREAITRGLIPTESGRVPARFVRIFREAVGIIKKEHT